MKEMDTLKTIGYSDASYQPITSMRAFAIQIYTEHTETPKINFKSTRNARIVSENSVQGISSM
jgi:hypothetical protein